METKLILDALQSVRGNRSKAAGILGITVRTLRNKINEYRAMGIEFPLRSIDMQIVDLIGKALSVRAYYHKVVSAISQMSQTPGYKEKDLISGRARQGQIGSGATAASGCRYKSQRRIRPMMVLQA